MPKDQSQSVDYPTPTDETMDKIAAIINAPTRQEPNVPMCDPMQRGAAAMREIDETSQRVWKAKPPKEMLGELNGHLVDGKVVIIHQLPSGKFVVYKRVSLAELQGDGDA